MWSVNTIIPCRRGHSYEISVMKQNVLVNICPPSYIGIINRNAYEIMVSKLARQLNMVPRIIPSLSDSTNAMTI